MHLKIIFNWRDKGFIVTSVLAYTSYLETYDAQIHYCASVQSQNEGNDALSYDGNQISE